MESAARSGNTTLKRRQRYLRKSTNAMNIGGKQFPCDDKIHKTLHEHQIEAHESQRCRIQDSGKRDHEDHIADRRCHSMTHHNLVHKPIPHPQVMMIPLLAHEWDKLQNLPAWRESKVKSKQEVILQAQNKEEWFIWLRLWTCVTLRLRNWTINSKHRKAVLFYVDAVFPVFGGAGAKPATEAELREFGENLSARPDEAEGPSLVLAPGGKVVENNPILKSCEDEGAEASAGATEAHPTMMGSRQRGATAPIHGEKKTSASRRSNPVHQSVRASHFHLAVSTLHNPGGISKKYPSISPLAVL